jgi:hypothetical protein
MAWTLIGAPTFTDETGSVRLGPLRVPLEGGLLVKLSTPLPPPFPYGYMVLSYLSSYGEELGRIQVWPRLYPTVYRMGEGMRVRDPHGELLLHPGTLSRRYIQAGFPQVVVVLADLPLLVGEDVLTPPGFVDPSGVDLSFTTAGAAARLAFPS